MSFKGKVVLVTGASSGIGAAAAIQFAAERAHVAIVGRNESKLKIVAEICEQRGNKPLVIIADVTKDDDVKRLVSDTLSHFKKLDVLVNNAGIGGSMSILDENAMQFHDKIMATDLRSAVFITHLAAPHLIETKGNIVNISSVAGSVVLSKIHSAYCAAKAGLDHFTRCVALELASKGVRVNSVNPGPVRTCIIDNLDVPDSYKEKMWNKFHEATANGQISEPEDVADIILYLASEKAKGITGSSYLIDNGMALKGGYNI